MTSDRSLSRWSLTGKNLEWLLGALDPDRERAALQYENMRRRLDALFRFWGADDGWDLADRTLDRVAVKLAEGAPVPSPALPAYVRGVARLIFHEWLRRHEQEQRSLESAPVAEVPDEDREHALSMLDVCLNTLDAKERRLVLDYYAPQPGSSIELRRQLALRMGGSLTALRIRVHRLRQRLEGCVAAAMKRSATIRHLADKG